jgi:hypothetical protein
MHSDAKYHNTGSTCLAWTIRYSVEFLGALWNDVFDLSKCTVMRCMHNTGSACLAWTIRHSVELVDQAIGTTQKGL